MKGTRKTYEQITKLPASAQTIRNYADAQGITVSYVYKLYAKGKVRIVTFENINFVIP